MRPRAREQRICLAVSFLAAGVLGASVTLLAWDWMEAYRRLPEDQKRLADLELAVREDAEQTPVLTAEYEKQRDATLERRERADLYAVFVIASASLFFVTAKWGSAARERAPTPPQIRAHRRQTPEGPKRKRTKRSERRRATPPADSPSPVPDLDLSFVERVVVEEGTTKEAAITILQRLQAHYRYLPDAALRRVCELTEISPAQIAGVSSFYAQFRRSPVGRFVVKVCHGTACHVSGAAPISQELRRHLRLAPAADTDPEGIFTIDEVACVGCCSLAPVLTIEEKTLGGLSPSSAREAVESFRREHAP